MAGKTQPIKVDVPVSINLKPTVTGEKFKFDDAWIKSEGERLWKKMDLDRQQMNRVAQPPQSAYLKKLAMYGATGTATPVSVAEQRAIQKRTGQIPADNPVSDFKKYITRLKAIATSELNVLGSIGLDPTKQQQALALKVRSGFKQLTPKSSLMQQQTGSNDIFQGLLGFTKLGASGQIKGQNFENIKRHVETLQLAARELARFSSAKGGMPGAKTGSKESWTMDILKKPGFRMGATQISKITGSLDKDLKNFAEAVDKVLGVIGTNKVKALKEHLIKEAVSASGGKLTSKEAKDLMQEVLATPGGVALQAATGGSGGGKKPPKPPKVAKGEEDKPPEYGNFISQATIGFKAAGKASGQGFLRGFQTVVQAGMAGGPWATIIGGAAFAAGTVASIFKSVFIDPVIGALQAGLKIAVSEGPEWARSLSRITGSVGGDFDAMRSGVKAVSATLAPTIAQLAIMPQMAAKIAYEFSMTNRQVSTLPSYFKALNTAALTFGMSAEDIAGWSNDILKQIGLSAQGTQDWGKAMNQLTMAAHLTSAPMKDMGVSLSWAVTSFGNLAGEAEDKWAALVAFSSEFTRNSLANPRIMNSAASGIQNLMNPTGKWIDLWAMSGINIWNSVAGTQKLKIEGDKLAVAQKKVNDLYINKGSADEIRAAKSELQTQEATVEAMYEHLRSIGELDSPDAITAMEGLRDLAGVLHTDPILFQRLTELMGTKSTSSQMMTMMMDVFDKVPELMSKIKDSGSLDAYIANLDKAATTSKTWMEILKAGWSVLWQGLYDKVAEPAIASALSALSTELAKLVTWAEQSGALQTLGDNIKKFVESVLVPKIQGGADVLINLIFGTPGQQGAALAQIDSRIKTFIMELGIKLVPLGVSLGVNIVKGMLIGMTQASKIFMEQMMGTQIRHPTEAGLSNLHPMAQMGFQLKYLPETMAATSQELDKLATSLSRVQEAAAKTNSGTNAIPGYEGIYRESP